MRKRICLLAAALVLAFPGCAGKAQPEKPERENQSDTNEDTSGRTESPDCTGKNGNKSGTVSPTPKPTPSAAAAPAKNPAPSGKPDKTSACTPEPTKPVSVNPASANPAETEKNTPSAAPASPSATVTAQPEPAAPAPEPAHTHHWVEETKSVHHEAVTEQIWVVDREAWEEPVYEDQPVYETFEKTRCRFCGEVFDCHSDWKAHRNALIDAGDYAHGSYEVVWETIQTGTQTVRTGTVLHPESGHFETVVLTPAYDENIVTGYRCSECGIVK